MTPPTTGPLCPQCNKPATGNFCQQCGASLGGRFCNQCGGKVGPSAKFCNQCGSKVSGATVARHREAAVAAVGGQNLPWWIAGAAMFALIFFVGLQMVRPAGPAVSAGSAGGGAPVATGAGAPDISNLSPIEAADRLFNRVMSSVSQGDSAQAQAFLPMAIAAYQRARPLSADGLFHLSLLNRTALNLEASLDNAVEILEQDPNHLLGLAAAAEASIELGELDEAEVYYRRILEIYDDERDRGLEEYEMHSAIVGVLKDDAERFLAGR